MEEAKAMIGKLLDEYLNEIDQAFLKSEKGLAMGLTVKIVPDSPNVQIMEVKLSFIAARVKALAAKYVSEAQGALLPNQVKTRVTIGTRKGSVEIHR